ncbi:MAG: GHKL domain-containing protein, partial [Leptospiraceae bacterium]|nr:GHKL domain-containing protein [Leptospiraceae bacterium]
GTTIVLAILQTTFLFFYKRYLGVRFNFQETIFEFGVILLLNYILAFLVNLVKRRSFEDKILHIKKSEEEKSKSLHFFSSLDEFKNSLLAQNNPIKVCYAIDDFIEKVFDSNNSRIFIWAERKGVFICHREEISNSEYHVYDPFFLWLADHDEVISRKNKELYKDPPENWDKIFKSENAEIIVPLIMNLSVIGVIFIQQKNNNQEFTKEEIEKLNEIKSVTMMSLSNAIFYEKMISLTENLEKLVKERTRELEETQSQLILSEKMASLGVMVAGIAHEINTPSGVISNSEEILTNNLNYIINHLDYFVEVVQKANSKDSLDKVIENFVKEVNLKGVDSRQKFKIRKLLREKIKEQGIDDALVDDLSNFIIDRNYLEIEDLLISMVAEGGKDILELLKNLSGIFRNLHHIKYAIKNIIRIVRALKYYSHLDQAEEEESNIIEGIENTLIIMGNQLKHGIELTKSYEDIPLIRCNPDQLNQVWTNIIQNAIHATGGEGKIHINVFPMEKDVAIEIIDNGPGIPLEIQEKIWDPFFTTKDQGQGTGLGLGIVKGIIEKHSGKISVNSKPGQTKFSVHLPIKKPIITS